MQKATLMWVIGITTWLSGCDEGTSQRNAVRKTVELQQSLDKAIRENSDLVAKLETDAREISALKAQVSELSLTPATLLARVSERVGDGDIAAARAELSQMKERFATAPEMATAEKYVDDFVAKQKAKERQAQLVASQGFKAIPIESAKTQQVTATIGKVSFSKKFVFDRYSDSYHYIDADRDSKYLVAPMSVTASKGVFDPALPGVALYWPDGSSLRKISDADIRLSRWADYGAYLGNYGDSGNDFAKTAIVRFEIGVQGTEGELGHRPLYLIGTKAGCVYRHEGRFEHPPVSYRFSCGDSLGRNLLPSDFTSTESKLVILRRID